MPRPEADISQMLNTMATQAPLGVKVMSFAGQCARWAHVHASLPAGEGVGEDEEQRSGGRRGVFVELSAPEPRPTPGSYTRRVIERFL